MNHRFWHLLGVAFILYFGLLPPLHASAPVSLPMQAGRSWYVSPRGSPSGDGSLDRPWDLPTALRGGLGDEANAESFGQQRVRPGDTIWLRGGFYTNPQAAAFVSYLLGEPGRPVIVRQFPGERAIVNPGIQTYGHIRDGEIDYEKSSSYQWFWGFEITNTQKRTLPESERWKRGPGLQFFGRGHKAINLVLRDAGHPAIQAGEWAEGAEIYGCLIWGSGLYQVNDNGSVTVRGSGVYAQNRTDVRRVSDLISFRNFTTGMKTWSQETHGYGFIFDGNISFANGDRNIFAGSDNPLRDLTLTHNYTYRPAGDPGLSVQLGYSQDIQNENLLVAYNYLVGGSRASEQGAISLQSWVSGQVSYNTLVVQPPVEKEPGYTLVGSYYEPAPHQGRLSIHHNNWFGTADMFWFNRWDAGGDYTYERLGFTEWAEAIGYDASRRAGLDPRTNQFTQSLPRGTRVFLRPNRYEAGRAHLAVYNWGRRSTISVNLSAVLRPGDRFQILDAQNYFGRPVVSGRFSGRSIEIPLNLGRVQPLYDPYHEITHLQNRHTAPEFAAFVVLVEPGSHR